jgi:flavin-binding protein dodecin
MGFTDYKPRGVLKMTESLYKVIQLVGSSPNGWEDAVQKAVADASKTLRDLRIVTVDELDCRIEEGKIVAYRARVRLSFKYEA